MSGQRVVAAIALGSNLGDRAGHLERAVREIASIAGVTLVGVSRWIETEAEGHAAGQPRFLNGAIVVETRLSPRELLLALQSIEHTHARERPAGVRHAPRTLDLDLIAHGDAVVDEPSLTVPHPHARQRGFVMDRSSRSHPICVFRPTCADPPRACAICGARSVRALRAPRRALPTGRGRREDRRHGTASRLDASRSMRASSG